MWTGGAGGGGVQRGTTNGCSQLESAAGWAFVWCLSEAALLRQVEVEVRRWRRQKRGPFMEAGKEVWEGCCRRNKRALCSHMVRGGEGLSVAPCDEEEKNTTHYEASMLVLAAFEIFTFLQRLLRWWWTLCGDVRIKYLAELLTEIFRCKNLLSWLERLKGWLARWNMVARAHKPHQPSSLLV